MAAPLIFDGRPPVALPEVDAEYERGLRLEQRFRSGEIEPEALDERFQEAMRDISLTLGLHENGELILTSSGEEAVHTAVKGAMWSGASGRRDVVTVQGDPDAFSAATEWCEPLGFSRKSLSPLMSGSVRATAKQLSSAALLAMAYTAPLLHSRRDVAAISEVCGETGTHFALDFTKVLPLVNPGEWMHAVDFLCAGLESVGAPSGCGLLWVRSGVHWGPLLAGKEQGGRRAGRVSLALTLASARAVKAAASGRHQRIARFQEFQNVAMEMLRRLVPDAMPAASENPLPLGLCFLLPNLEAEALVLELKRDDLHISSGSACQSVTGKPAPILTAVGYSPELASGAVHLSWRDEHRLEDVRRLMQCLARGVQRLRAVSGNDN